MRFSPSTIIPSDFSHYDMYDLGGMGEGEFPFNTGPCQKYMDEGAGPVENHDGLGKCDVCGSHHRYGEVWVHNPSDLRLCVGHVCAAKYGLFASNPEYKNKHAAHIRKVEQIKKRRRVRAEMKEFLQDHRDLGSYLRADHHIVRDLRAKLICWGSISDKQIALARKISKEIAQRAAVEAEKNYVAVPETDKRIEITGRVLGVKFVEGFGYNSCDITKMIVEVEADGGVYKLYGTMPRVIEDQIVELRDEDAEDWESLKDIIARVKPRVSFVAKVERSDKDEHFGFFKRPTKAEVIA